MQPDTWATNEKVDLTNCDREPIHIPGRIQPHGVLLALEEQTLKILQISQNTDSLLGVESHELLGKNLDALFPPFLLETFDQRLKQDAIKSNPQNVYTGVIGRFETSFDVIVHRFGSVLIIELERTDLSFTSNSLNYYVEVRNAISSLQDAASLLNLCQKTTDAVHRLTGFNRVMLYRFLEDGSGSVIAETRSENIEPFLNLRYPASDIPQQARRLYVLNRLRLIPDVDYQPITVEPVVNSLTNKPLDLSYSILRSVSPIHIEYLKNMGVSASMSISLVKNDGLWGLIACHHYSPKYPSFDVRASCELLAEIFSSQIVAKENFEDADYKLRMNEKLAQFVVSMSKESLFTNGLIKSELNLLDFIEASGAALCVNGDCTLLGQTPSEREVKLLTEWLAENFSDEVYSNDSLPSVYQPALDFKHLASGLLAVSLNRNTADYALWFRPEVIQTVNWSGDPNKPVEVSANGEQRLSPRKSFALWQESVRLKSLPWKKAEIDAAKSLRQAISETFLSRAEQLAQLNTELERSNEELDAFTYVASHDLKEPLRGIHNFSEFLIEGYHDRLDSDGQAKLQTLKRLTIRMEEMIDSLMHYARAGRFDLNLKPVDLNCLLDEILDLLQPLILEKNIDVAIPRSLPVLECDSVRAEEVFTNLLTNAIKYNEKTEKQIEIGYINPAAGEAKPLRKNQFDDERDQRIIFYVRDNGIGIREKHFDSVFRLFKRLHARDQFGGGTGAGLTIVKRIVERHGGEIWIESIYGEGTTFYFTLQK